MPKTVVITGATSGIGKAAALLFKEKGWDVFCLARRTVPDFECIPTDISDEVAVKRAFDEIYAKTGRIDVLVNNAGMGISGAVEDTGLDAVHKIFDVNFFGALNAIRCAVPYMRDNGGGTIVNVSSAAAPLSIPFQAFYSASKAALCSLAEALRTEVAPFGIKVTAILPGDVKTDFTNRREKNKADNPVYGERIARSVAVMERDEQNGMPPEYIAKMIYRLSVSKNPPVAKVGGAKYAFLVKLASLLPKRMVLFLIGKLYG